MKKTLLAAIIHLGRDEVSVEDGKHSALRSTPSAILLAPIHVTCPIWRQHRFPDVARAIPPPAWATPGRDPRPARRMPQTSSDGIALPCLLPVRNGPTSAAFVVLRA